MAGSPSARSHRRGFAYRGLPVVLTVVAAVIVVAAVMAARWGFSSQDDEDLMLHKVQRGTFVHDITERGSIESANNVEILCKVKPKNYTGTAIAWIIEEGTVIKPEDCLPEGVEITYEMIQKLKELEEAESATPREENGGTAKEAEPASGDGQSKTDVSEPSAEETTESEPAASETTGLAFAADEITKAEADAQTSESEPPPITIEELRKKMILVRFDSVGLENDRIQQEIIYQNSSAAVVAAQNALDTARIAKDEYLEGTYREAVLAKQIQISEAEVAINQAEQDLEFAEKLQRKGYATRQQVENEKVKLMKAKNQLTLLEKELEVLEQYSKVKTVKELDAAIISAEAKLKAEQASNQLDKEKLDDIEEQIANCTIFATHPGEVVYANEQGRHGHGEVVIQEGTQIRYNQAIIRIPDKTQMQVKAKISEGKISLVEVGQEAIIRLDAFPDRELRGKVTEVSEYPAGTGWFSSAVREYETVIKIDNPPPDLRPGMNAEVKVRVNRLDNVLKVPVQAIIEHGKKLYCIVLGENGLEKREVEIGASNDKYVVIQKGLAEGEEVVQNAVKYRGRVGLEDEKKEEAPAEGEPSEADETGSRRKSPEGGPVGPDSNGKPEADDGAARRRPNLAEIVAKVFKDNDKNNNGKLERDEVSGPLQSGFDAADTDGDGTVSRQELSATMRKFMSAVGSGGRPSGGRPPGGNP